MHDSLIPELQALIPELAAEVIFFHGTIFDFEVIEHYRPSIVICLQTERLFTHVPESGSGMLDFVAGEEKEKGARRSFIDFWKTVA